MYEASSFDKRPAYFSQMSEEIDNAALNVPRAIFSTMIINGLSGFGMVLAVMFCLGDIETVLVMIDPAFKQSIELTVVQQTPTGFPFIQIFYQGVRSKAAATGMASLIVILLTCVVIGFLATASRMTWSFARDRGMPFHRFISKASRSSHHRLVSPLALS